MLDISPLALNLAFHETELIPCLRKLLDTIVSIVKLNMTSKLNQLAFQNWAFAQSLDPSDLHALDQYWLLLFELFAAGEIKNPYQKDDTFEVMHQAGVRFML